MNLDGCRNRRIPDAGCCNPVCPKRRVLIGSDLPALVDNGEVLPQLPTRSSRGNSPSDLLAPVIRFSEGGCCVDLEVNLCIPALNYLGPLHLQLNRFRPRVGTDLLNGFQIRGVADTHGQADTAREVIGARVTVLRVVGGIVIPTSHGQIHLLP